jgi:hypothetical protein
VILVLQKLFSSAVPLFPLKPLPEKLPAGFYPELFICPLPNVDSVKFIGYWLLFPCIKLKVCCGNYRSIELIDPPDMEFSGF